MFLLGMGGVGTVTGTEDTATKTQEFFSDREGAPFVYAAGVIEAAMYGTFEEARTVSRVDGRRITIDMPRGETDLDALFRTRQRSRKNLEGMFAEILEAVMELHARGHIHLDIKPANILVVQDNRLRLIDFGAARPLNTIRHTAYTTEAAKPPEDRAPSTSNDAWALGTLFMWMLAGPQFCDARRPKRVNSRLWDIAVSLRAREQRSSLRDAYAKLKLKDEKLFSPTP